jgi:RHS repeat-associated protein
MVGLKGMGGGYRLSTPTGSYTYDANGNTLTDASGKSYTCDFENRLVSAVVPGTGTLAFKYDPFGRRIQNSSPIGTTNYLYDGPNLLEEIDQSGNLLARYSGGPGIDEPLAEVRSGSATYYEADGVGSVTSLTSASSTITGTYSYDSLGNLSASTGTVTNPHRYTGREFDAEAGIYEYRARYYDPAVGRFLSEDPIGFSGSVDFYTYTNNNPLNWTDPFGWDRVRVCCRPLRFMKPLLLFRIWHHCYIQITDADGTQTWGVLPPQPNQDDGSGQQPRVHDPRNSGGGCQDVPCKTCKTDGLRQKLRNSEFPVGTCPSCGPNYSNSWWAFDGNNSNTYVYNMINSTCGTPPREPRAPGYHFAPGW